MLCVFVLDCAPHMQAPLPLRDAAEAASSRCDIASGADIAMKCFDGAKCLVEAAAAELTRLHSNSLPIDLALFCSGIAAPSALVCAQLDDALAPSTGGATLLPAFEKAVRNLTSRPPTHEDEKGHPSKNESNISDIFSPSPHATVSMDQCIEEILDMLDARRAKLEVDCFGRGWAPWTAMPVHIYILSCSLSLTHPSQRRAALGDPPPARALMLPSLSRLYEGRARWDISTMAFSVGDKSSPSISTLPPLMGALLEETQGSIIACSSLQAVMAAVAPIAAFARRCAAPGAPPVRVGLRAPAASAELVVSCASKDSARVTTESVRWSIPEAFCWRGALDGLLRRSTCPRLRVGALNAAPGHTAASGPDLNSSQLQEMLQIANTIHFPYDCYTVMLSCASALQGNSLHRQEKSWEVFFSAVHLRFGIAGTSATEVLWIPVYVDQQQVANVTPQEQGGKRTKAKDSPVVAAVPGAPSVALLTGMLGVRRGAAGSSQGAWEAELILLPPNFHILLPLLRSAVHVPTASGSGGANVSGLSQPWRQGMASYMQSLPTYFFAPLSGALRMYFLQLCVPRGSEVQILSRGLWAHLRRLQARGAEGLGLWAQARRDNEAMKVWSASICSIDRPRPIDLIKQRDTRGIRDTPYKFVGYGDACLPPEESIDMPSLSRMSHWAGRSAELLRRRPKYNGGPDVDPWPASPCTLLLNPPPELASASSVAAISVPLESDDLFSVWERMRRDVFGGPLGLTARRLCVEGCEGSGARIRACRVFSPGGDADMPPDRKRQRLASPASRLNPDDAEEWTLWFNALGADLAPRYSSRSMGHYAAVLSRREALRDPHAVNIPGLPPGTEAAVPPDEDSPEEQARRKYRVHFGNPFVKQHRDGSARSKQLRKDVETKLGSDTEDERALFLDGTRAVTESNSSSARTSGGDGVEDEKNAFLSLFCDTPAPRQTEDNPLSLPGLMGEALANARVPVGAPIADMQVLRELPPLPLPRAAGKRCQPDPLRGAAREVQYSSRLGTIEVATSTSAAVTHPSSPSSAQLLKGNEPAPVKEHLAAAAPACMSPASVVEMELVNSDSGVKTHTQAAPQAPPSSPWVVRHSSKHNRSYWFNVLDGTSVWTKPPGVD